MAVEAVATVIHRTFNHGDPAATCVVCGRLVGTAWRWAVEIAPRSGASTWLHYECVGVCIQGLQTFLEEVVSDGQPLVH